MTERSCCAELLEGDGVEIDRLPSDRPPRRRAAARLRRSLGGWGIGIGVGAAVAARRRGSAPRLGGGRRRARGRRAVRVARALGRLRGSGGGGGERCGRSGGLAARARWAAASESGDAARRPWTDWKHRLLGLFGTALGLASALLGLGDAFLRISRRRRSRSASSDFSSRQALGFGGAALGRFGALLDLAQALLGLGQRALLGFAFLLQMLLGGLQAGRPRALRARPRWRWRARGHGGGLAGATAAMLCVTWAAWRAAGIPPSRAAAARPPGCAARPRPGSAPPRGGSHRPSSEPAARPRGRHTRLARAEPEQRATGGRRRNRRRWDRRLGSLGNRGTCGAVCDVERPAGGAPGWDSRLISSRSCAARAAAS